MLKKPLGKDSIKFNTEKYDLSKPSTTCFLNNMLFKSFPFIFLRSELVFTKDLNCLLFNLLFRIFKIKLPLRTKLQLQFFLFSNH